MFSVFRSLIFKLDPELAHTLAIKSLKLSPNKINNIKTDNSIETNFFGKKILNPIGIAAGFDKNAEVYNPLFRLGFGFVEVGTVTPKKQYGNPKPRVFRLEEDQALINRLGFNNFGADVISSRISSNLPNGLFGINIGPNMNTADRLEDYLICLRKFHKLCDYLTINISSPNTENLRNFHNKIELDQLLKTIQEEKKILKSKVFLALKISPDIEEKSIPKIAELLLKHEIDIVIISNSSDQNRNNLKNINKLEKGGLSGKPIEKKSNLLINKFYKLLKGKIKIIGVGGVDSGQAAYDKFLAGADFIQLYTGMVFKGPNIAGIIKKDLKELLIRDGVKNFTEIVGNKT